MSSGARGQICDVSSGNLRAQIQGVLYIYSFGGFRTDDTQPAGPQSLEVCAS